MDLHAPARLAVDDARVRGGAAARHVHRVGRRAYLKRRRSTLDVGALYLHKTVLVRFHSPKAHAAVLVGNDVNTVVLRPEGIRNSHRVNRPQSFDHRIHQLHPVRVDGIREWVLTRDDGVLRAHAAAVDDDGLPCRHVNRVAARRHEVVICTCALLGENRAACHPESTIRKIDSFSITSADAAGIFAAFGV